MHLSSLHPIGAAAERSCRTNPPFYCASLTLISVPIQPQTNVLDLGVASVLPAVLQCIHQLTDSSDKALRGDLVMCLLSILYLLDPKNYQSFLQSLKGEETVRVRFLLCLDSLRLMCSSYFLKCADDIDHALPQPFCTYLRTAGVPRELVRFADVPVFYHFQDDSGDGRSSTSSSGLPLE